MASRKLLTPAVAAVLIAGVALIWRAPPSQFLSDDQKPLARLGDADSFMRGVSTVVFAADGSVSGQISAAQSAFYRDQQDATLSGITVISHSRDGRPITLSGRRGLFTGSQNQLQLNGDVLVTTLANDGPTELRGEQFRYQMATNQLHSDQPFTMTSAASELRGAALRADLEQHSYTITGSVRGRHQPQ